MHVLLQDVGGSRRLPPWQVFPLAMRRYPAGQRHLWLPAVFTHSCWQTSFTSHSLMSEKYQSICSLLENTNVPVATETQLFVMVHCHCCFSASLIVTYAGSTQGLKPLRTSAGLKTLLPRMYRSLSAPPVPVAPPCGTRVGVETLRGQIVVELLVGTAPRRGLGGLVAVWVTLRAGQAL